jgi:hypothetical protein
MLAAFMKQANDMRFESTRLGFKAHTIYAHPVRGQSKFIGRKNKQHGNHSDGYGNQFRF